MPWRISVETSALAATCSAVAEARFEKLASKASAASVRSVYGLGEALLALRQARQGLRGEL